ncbi:hypothetical protein MERGE_003023 [Pneumocystis wakefieldiae]|uniref:SERRATE/Ars2 N-terminal domain-containing protein n=1 Tax=Pneumocystis wakefieldiae TaxID=38082 RepID=A0A899FP24_9ASCO|nr:hypothetical protein MERGE_003023 [Pneumocystis wakefieldiae]
MSSLDYYRPPHDLLDDRKRRLDKDAYDDDRNVKSRYLYREGGRRYSNGRSGSRDSDEYRLKHDFSRGYGSHKKVDPYTSNYLVPFTIFNEWYKSTNTSMDIEDNEMYQKYEAYKQDLYARLAKPFVYKHMDEPWFREKYQPDSRSPIYKKILETKKAARIVFLQCLRERAFDKFTMDDDDGPESERGSVPIENVIHIFEESFDDNLKTNKEVLSIKNITPNVSYADITSLLSGHSIVKNIILSGPNPFRGFMREGFVELNDTNGVENLIQTIQSQKPNEKAGPITVVFYSSPSFSKKILLPPLSNTFENLSKDLEFAIQAVKKLDAKMDKNFDFTEEVKDYLGLSTFDFQEDSNDGHNMMKKILDLLIEYLRQV